MVRIQPMNNKHDISRRSNLSWDKTRKPTKSILKNVKNYDNKKHVSILIKHPSTETEDIFEINKLPPSPEVLNTKISNDELELQDLLKNLTINPKKETEIIEQRITKVSKLYRLFDHCSYYDVSTSFTIQYSLSYHRINKIINHEALINVVDIYNLPLLIYNVIVQHQGDEQTNTENNDFFCNAYWVIYLTYSITNLVFEKLIIDRKSYITYEPNRTDFKNCDIKEHTHIIRHQISVCEWLIVTTAPSYRRNNVPHELGMVLIKELKRLYYIIDSNDQIWLNNCIRLLC